MGTFLDIVAPLIQEGVHRGLIARSVAWVPQSWEQAVRYTATLDGDLPALVELKPSRAGMQVVSWAIVPQSPDVAFPTLMETNSWPGEAWGTFAIDRRTGFRLTEWGRFHCRRNFRRRLVRLPVATMADDLSSLAHAA